MRMPCIMLAVLLMTAGYARSMESDVSDFKYYDNTGPALYSVLVSLSIGHPKGWTAFEDPDNLQRADIYNDIPIDPTHLGPICSFSQPRTDSLKPDFTGYTIWRSSGATAKAAAEKFTASMTPHGSFTEFKSLNPIKTNAGDSGWLVESTGYMVTDPTIGKLMRDPASWKGTSAVQEMIQIEKNLKPSQKAPIVYHDFFFHVGHSAIRIEIMTHADNSSWRSDLDQLILQTLRFNDR